MSRTTNAKIASGYILFTTALGLIVSLSPAPWPGVSDYQTLKPTRIVSTTSVGSPGIVVDASVGAVSPSAIAASSNIKTPSISAGGITVSPSAITPNSLVASPSVQGNAAPSGNIATLVISTTSTVAQPSVSSGTATVAPALTQNTSSVANPRVSAGTNTIAPANTQNTNSVPSPSMSLGAANVAPSAIASAAALPSPSVALTAPAGPAWTQERQVTIANSANDNTPGYQSLVTLSDSNFDFASAKSDGSDLRFTDNDKTTALPFWIERFDKTAKTARVWVKSDLPAGASKSVYMYSANDQAINKSAGENVFPFFDDCMGLPGWNVYAVPNPVIQTSSGEAIVGDPMVLPPDALTNEWGAFYFTSSGSSGDVGYFTISGSEGETFTKIGKVLDHANFSYQRVIKPSVIYWPADNCYYMVATCENDGQDAVLGLFKSTSRTSGWTFVKVLLTADPSILLPDGSQLENTFIDCGFFLFDGSNLRLYYSANTIGNREPKYFCLANFAAGPTSQLTRYANNPIAKPNPSTTYANVGLGGMAVRKITQGEYAGKFEFSYNAFTSGEVSNSFIGYSDDGLSLAIRDEDRVIPLGGPASWNRVRNYRICGYNYLKPNEAATQAVLNALGDTEQIGYIKKGRKLDLAKWTPNLQGKPRVNFENGNMRVGETRTSDLAYYFVLASGYVPSDNIVLETRARIDTQFTPDISLFAPLMIGSQERPFPDAAGNIQAIFVMDRHKQVRHQNRNNGSWGDEDTIVNSYPTIGSFYNYRMTKKAASMDYEVFNDTGASIGAVLNNTDAPQGASLPFLIGGQGAEMSFDYILARKYLPTIPTVTIGPVSTVSKTNL